MYMTRSAMAQVFCVWLTPNQDLAYVLATGYVAASILLSGFYLRVADMKLAVMRGLSYLSYTKYGSTLNPALWQHLAVRLDAHAAGVVHRCSMTVLAVSASAVLQAPTRQELCMLSCYLQNPVTTATAGIEQSCI